MNQPTADEVECLAAWLEKRAEWAGIGSRAERSAALLRRLQAELTAIHAKDHELNAADELIKAEREIERLQQEYVCRCGLRVIPHRCPTTSEF